MRYRRLDENWDMCFGRGVSDYLEDANENPVAVAQAIKSRLLLFLGEWWMDINDGLPLWQQILGQRIKNKEVIDQILVDRINRLKMPDGRSPIVMISSVSSTHDPETRDYSFSCTVDTVYGKLYITNANQNQRG